MQNYKVYANVVNMQTTKINRNCEVALPKELITGHSVRKETAARISRVEKELSHGFEIVDKHRNTVTIFGSARFTEDNPYYKKAVEVSSALSMACYTPVTGGGGGIMEAGNRGAFEVEGETLGFNIQLPHEQVLNPYTTANMPFRYFFARKVILAYGAMGYVFFPGGFGTLDEFFEILTLIQTRKIPKAPLILVGGSFWKNLDKYLKENMLEQNQTISPGDETLYTITDDINEIVSIINHYRDTDYLKTL